MAPLTLSPATLQVLSYVAHDKKVLEEGKGRSPCRPKYNSTRFCGHVDRYIKSRMDSAVENRYGRAFFTLKEVGQEKTLCAVASNTSFNEIDNFTLSCISPIKIHSTFGQYVNKDRRTGGTVVCDDSDMNWTFQTQMIATQRIDLVDRLNKLGEPYGLTIRDSGAYTVLDLLNKTEAAALDVIVERDAQELKEQVKKFNDNTRFTYKTIGVDPENPPHYREALRPRPLHPSDFPVYGVGFNSRTNTSYSYLAHGPTNPEPLFPENPEPR